MRKEIDMVMATMEDRLKWAGILMTTNDPKTFIATVDKIWEDGYRTAEAEVTYAYTKEA